MHVWDSFFVYESFLCLRRQKSGSFWDPPEAELLRKSWGELEGEDEVNCAYRLLLGAAINLGVLTDYY